MSVFMKALDAWLDGFAVGEEKVMREFDYVNTVGKQTLKVHACNKLRREGPDEVVHVLVERPRGKGATEQEIERWSVRGLKDMLFSTPHVRGWLGLPSPMGSELIDRAIERLRAGETFRVGGADDGGGHSGRGTSGEWNSLCAEGDHFVHESESFYTPQGSDAPTEQSHEKRTLDEVTLRAELTSNAALRGLVGLP